MQFMSNIHMAASRVILGNTEQLLLSDGLVHVEVALW